MSSPVFTAATVVADVRCLCGEGPLYDARRDCLFWTDIDAARLFRYDPATRSHRVVYAGDPKTQQVGGFTLQPDGSLLLFRMTDIARFDPDSGSVSVLTTFNDPGVPRFNDTSAGPDGSCYAGTMGRTDTSGGLFRLAPGGTLNELFRGTGCANGMGWSPDRRTMYWTCSTRNTIFAYDYDPASGTMGRERVFLKVTDRAADGTADGLTVDSQGNIYSARWGGHGVYVYRPDGTFLTKLSLPVPMVTSLTFAGPDLCDLYFTTASRGTDLPAAGSLFHCRSSIPGQSEFTSRIDLPS